MNTNDDQNTPAQASSAPAAGSAPGGWPVEARISHRVLIYAAQRSPHAMNQFTIEEIVREELAKEPNVASERQPT
jgi:hypothetical protein